MLPNGDANTKDIDNSFTVKPHTHSTSDIVDFKSALETSISLVRGQVPEDGNTLGKLYDYIVSGSLQIVVPDIQTRDSLEINSLSTQVFVVDAGNGWGLFKPLQIGSNVEFVKISDSEMLNSHLGVGVLTKALLPQSVTAAASELVMGSDVRLSDSRPPLPHEHSVYNITGLDAAIEQHIDNALLKLPQNVVSINNRQGTIELTKSDVGLDKVDNTPDIDKPISTRVQMALSGKINTTILPTAIQSGDNEIVMGIDPRLRDSRLPLAHEHHVKDINELDNYVANIIDSKLDGYNTGVVTVNDKSGIVILTKTDIGLDKVNNTSDDDKPVSEAQRIALLSKVDISLLPVHVDGKLVIDTDERLINARKPLPHTTDLITDYIDSTLSISKTAIKSFVDDYEFDTSNDTLSLSVMKDLVPGKYTRIYVNSKGRVTSGSSPTTIREMGIHDVYDKTQVDNLFANIPNTLESNTPNRFVKLNDAGKVPDNLLIDNLHFYPRYTRFPADGNPGHLYIDKETNTIYRFETDYVKLTPEQVVQPTTTPINKDDFAKVAFTGSYFDLNMLPVYHSIAKSGDYNELKNLPTYANVAKTGSFNDLVDTPTFADITWSGSYLDLHNTPDFADVAVTGSYTSLSDLPDLSQYMTKSDTSLTKTKTLNYIGTLGPRNGTARWYPESNVTILYAYATVNNAAYSDIVCHISHNLRPVNDASITIQEGEFQSEYKQLNFAMKSSDFLTVDIIQAVGKNLSVTIVYR